MDLNTIKTFRDYQIGRLAMIEHLLKEWEEITRDISKENVVMLGLPNVWIIKETKIPYLLFFNKTLRWYLKYDSRHGVIEAIDQDIFSVRTVEYSSMTKSELEKLEKLLEDAIKWFKIKLSDGVYEFMEKTTLG